MDTTKFDPGIAYVQKLIANAKIPKYSKILCSSENLNLYDALKATVGETALPEAPSTLEGASGRQFSET